VASRLLPDVEITAATVVGPCSLPPPTLRTRRHRRLARRLV